MMVWNNFSEKSVWVQFCHHSVSNMCIVRWWQVPRHIGSLYWRSHAGSKCQVDSNTYSQNCLYGHLFQQVTCPYGQLSVTPLRFHYLFDSCIMVSSQRSHGQSFCTPKWPLTVKAMLTDGQLNHLQKRLRLLLIAFSSCVLRIYLSTVPRGYVNKVWDDSVYWWPHLLGVV